MYKHTSIDVLGVVPGRALIMPPMPLASYTAHPLTRRASLQPTKPTLLIQWNDDISSHPLRKA